MCTGCALLSASTTSAIPPKWAATEVEAFLSWLTVERSVAVSTHRLALAALLFFYGKVLGIELPWL
jgi:hypothetical protein